MAPTAVDPTVIVQILKELATLIHRELSDPVKDNARIMRLKSAYTAVEIGDQSIHPEFGTTFAGQPMNGIDYLRYIEADVPAPAPQHGTSSGSVVARTYARVLLLQLRAEGHV